MDMIVVLGLLCITVSCGFFLGHAAGYVRGRKVGYRKGADETRAHWKMRMNAMYGKPANANPYVSGNTYAVNSLYPTEYKAANND